ncbi:MAG: hypothetical protein HY770_04420 [Chitinivibrionia bacterium]|nr:hypothetical protein [Chitinivibrionia bacterium]
MFAIILEDLRKRYGDKVLLDPEDLEAILGVSTGQQANLRSQNRFPIPITKVGGRIKVSIYDLAKHLAGAAKEEAKAQIATDTPPATKKESRSEKKAKRGLLEKNWWLFRGHHIISILDHRQLLDDTSGAPFTSTSYDSNL